MHGGGVAPLVSYLVYHTPVGARPFPRQGWIRPVYFAILITLTVLAAAVVPLALVTLARGLRADFPRHARLARWTAPVWLCVSATGVLAYVMRHRLPCWVTWLAQAAAWARHAHPDERRRLRSSMAWSGFLVGLMPYTIGLVVLGVVLHVRRASSRGAQGDEPG